MAESRSRRESERVIGAAPLDAEWKMKPSAS
jgi:hypothetical protein